MRIGVLGCGNMANAIMEGLLKSNIKFYFHFFTPTLVKAKKMAEKMNGDAYLRIEDMPNCDYYIAACKPQQFLELASELKPFFPKKSLLISILAGTSIKTIQDQLGSQVKVARVMPNTPCLVGEGVSAIYFSNEVEERDKDVVVSIFESISKAFVVPSEDEVDLITVVAGSGPAYFFEIIRILAFYLEKNGIETDKANDIAIATCYGAGKLIHSTDESAENLRNQVTSKGGVTEKVLDELKSSRLEELFHKALMQGQIQTKKLSGN